MNFDAEKVSAEIAAELAEIGRQWRAGYEDGLDTEEPIDQPSVQSIHYQEGFRYARFRLQEIKAKQLDLLLPMDDLLF